MTLSRNCFFGMMLLGLTGCGIGDSDNAGSTTGPTIHCGAERFNSDTTTVVRCPGVAP